MRSRSASFGGRGGGLILSCPQRSPPPPRSSTPAPLSWWRSSTLSLTLTL